MKKQLFKIITSALGAGLLIGNMTIYAEKNTFTYEVGDTPGKILIDPTDKNTRFWDKYNAPYQDGAIGECVWYAKGRFCEIYGTYVQYMDFGKDKNDWIKNIQNGNIVV